MRKAAGKKWPVLSPGIWSTDEYIRQWAKRQGMAGECVVALQSLHDEWKAIISFDQDGHPVRRISTAVQRPLCA